ncbi:MAG TPA: hypothetical protein VM581_04880 [Magnetospirillaceae bacterium]|nr:hypothetical protein [Magnetospirillaceae bacterium]
MAKTLIAPAHEPRHPSMRLAVQACIDLARMQVEDERRKVRIIARVHKLEPNILLGERFGYEALILNGKPVVVFFRGQVVCRLIGYEATQLIRGDKATWWRLPGKKEACADWVMLNRKLPVGEIATWAERAVVQVGVA